ncbi:MAG TPA: hypothetical protein VF841_19790 [Anaeromyxobacter sp.]
MRISLVPVALALAACGGPDRGGASAALWVGEAGAARVLAVSADGRVLSTAAARPALDAPVRALALLADGAVLVLQEPSGGGAPGVVVGRDGARVATLAATDAGGAPLFDAAGPPWAAAQAADGRIWVTGRLAPVIFGRDGALVGTAAPLPLATRGVAALADGRVLVTCGASSAALYAADGASAEPLAISVGANYSGVDAVAARPGGGLVLAVLRHGVTTDGVLVDVALAPGVLAATGDPEASARLPELPSALAIGAGVVVAAPSLGALAPPGCAEALSADLRERRGCVAPGAHRGVVRLR